MGGGSGSSSSSSSDSTTKYSTTTTSNPYVTSTTNNSGTTTTLKDGTALSSIYNFTNNNMDQLLNDYLNPSLDSTTNQALLNSYTKTLNSETRKNLENNIISPLASRNMIRSSQATDLYNNLANQNADAISDYAAELLSNSQSNTGDIITNLMNYALQGYNVISGNQAQSLNTSSGNSTTSSSTSGSSSSYSYGL